MVLQLARENSSWGYLQIAGELRKLGVAVSPSSVRNILTMAACLQRRGAMRSHGAASCERPYKRQTRTRTWSAGSAPSRRECLDRLLIVSRHELEHILRVYVRHYNRQRPHRELDLKPPDSMNQPPLAKVATLHALQVHRRDLLDGLIHEYELAAA